MVQRILGSKPPLLAHKIALKIALKIGSSRHEVWLLKFGGVFSEVEILKIWRESGLTFASTTFKKKKTFFSILWIQLQDLALDQ